MGASTAQYQVTDTWVRSREITYSTKGSYAAVEVPAGTFIPSFGVYIYITTAFAGCTAISVGDSTVAGWVGAGDITLGTAGTYGGTAANATYNDSGKIYTSADTIDVTLSSAATAGACYLFVRMVNLSDIYDD